MLVLFVILIPVVEKLHGGSAGCHAKDFHIALRVSEGLQLPLFCLFRSKQNSSFIPNFFIRPLCLFHISKHKVY